MPAGVIKVLDGTEKGYYKVKDVMGILDVSRNKAYTMIRAMREDLIEEGILHRTYPPGRVPKEYFDKMCMIK